MPSQSRKALPLSSGHYNELLTFLREIDGAKDEIRRACRPPDGKLALAVAPHALYWWGFYELPFLRTVAFVAAVMRLDGQLRAASEAENPTRAFMDSMRGEPDQGVGDFVGLDRATRALLVGALLSLVYSLDAVKYYGLTIDELLSAAAAGNKSALGKALTVDPLAVVTRVGSSILAARALVGEGKHVARLLAAKVPVKRRQSRELRFMHRMLKDVGALESITTAQLVDLVCGALNLYAAYSADAGKNLREQFRRFDKDTTT
jgi:hypothetical protein